jgi:hypothetical protein
MAAALLSALTGIPFVLRHAGSDRYRLMKNADLWMAYRTAFSSADLVQTAGGDYFGLGVDPDKASNAPSGTYIPPEFHPGEPALDLTTAIDDLSRLGWSGQTGQGAPDPGKPVVGMYGKAGISKGTFALLDTIADHPSLGNVQVVLVSGGPGMAAVREHVWKHRLNNRVWTMPFLPHWRMASFIRACDAVCALEHNFPIPQHGTGIVREILACGTPLVLSEELARKDSPPSSLTAINRVVCDPGDTSSVKRALETAFDGPAISDEEVTALQGQIADERLSMASWFEKCLISASQSRPPHTAQPRAIQSAVDKRREWIAEQAPTLWRLSSAELESICARDYAATVDFLYAIVGYSNEVASADHDTDDAADDWALARLEAALLWMHTNWEAAGGVGPFQFPRGCVPVSALPSSELTPYPPPHVRRPLSTRLRLALEVTPEAFEEINRRIRASGNWWVPLVQIPDGIGTGRKYLWLFTKSPSLEGVIYRVSNSIVRVLDLCDGSRNREEIERNALGPGRNGAVVDAMWLELVSRQLTTDVWFPEEAGSASAKDAVS